MPAHFQAPIVGDALNYVFRIFDYLIARWIVVIDAFIGSSVLIMHASRTILRAVSRSKHYNESHWKLLKDVLTRSK